MRPRRAEGRRGAQGPADLRVHAAHPLQLRAHLVRGPPAGRAEPTQPRGLPDHRAARRAAGRLHSAQLRQLRAARAAEVRPAQQRCQGARGRHRLRVLQPGAVYRARRLRPAQRGAAGAAGPALPPPQRQTQDPAGVDGRAGPASREDPAEAEEIDIRDTFIEGDITDVCITARDIKHEEECRGLYILLT